MTNNTVDLLQIRIENAKEKLPVETTNAIAAVDWKAVILGLRDKKGYNFEQLGDLELETELLLCGLTSSAEYPKELQTRMRISKAETDELVNEMNTLVFTKIKAELIKNTERKKIFQKSTEKEEDPIRARKGSSASNGTSKSDMQVLKSAGIEVIPARNAFSIADAGGKPELELHAPNKGVEESREDILKKVENPASTRIIEPMRGGPAPTRVVEPMRGEPETPRIGALHPLLTQKILGSIQVPIVKTEHTMENITNNDKVSGDTSTVKTAKIDPYRELPE